MDQLNSNNYLLYLAHGSQEFKSEVLGSVLSYLNLKQHADANKANILIYTDSSDYFKQVLGEIPEIEYVIIPNAQLQEWRGKIDFVHRMKIELLLNATVKYGGNILYLDSDTYFVQDDLLLFQSIQRGQRFMHVQENILSQTQVPLHQTLYSFLCKHPTAEWADISPATVMYNAGAIGVGKADIPLLKNVLNLTDLLYGQCPSHIVEQFAFSYCFQRAGQVHEAIPYILHYWHMKDARAALTDFFSQATGKPLAELLREFHEIPLLAASQTKFAWEARPRWQRGIARIFGRQWKWPS